MTEQFLNYILHEKRYSAHTVLAYRQDLEQCKAFLEKTYNIEFVAATHLELRSWIYDLVADKKNKASSVKRKISVLKAFYKFLLKKELVSTNPTTKLISPKMPQTLPTFVVATDMERVLQTDNFTYKAKSTFSATRNALIVETLYATGMRCSELMDLKLMDIDRSARTIRISGKGSKTRLIPYPNYLDESLNQYMEARQEAFPLTTVPNLLLTDKGKVLYPKLVYLVVSRVLTLFTHAEKQGPHVLRHTFATHLLDSGADLNAIKELLGHTSLASTQVYTHNSAEKLKKAYKQAHSRSQES